MQRSRTAPDLSKSAGDAEEQQQPPVPPSSIPLWTHIFGGSGTMKLPQLIIAALLVVSTLVVVSAIMSTRRSVVVPVSSVSIVHTHYSSSSRNGDQQVQTSTRAIATQYTTTTTTATATTGGGAVNAPRKGAVGWTGAADAGVQQAVGADLADPSDAIPADAADNPAPTLQQEADAEDERQEAAEKAARAKEAAGRPSEGQSKGKGKAASEGAGGQQSSSAPTSSSSSSTPIPPPTEVPADFDWKAYLNHYPSLRRKGIDTEQKAKDHWLKSGHRERRIYKKPRVTLRYTACGGLSNQQYSHIAALTLASHLNASLVFPPALTRNSFASYFNMNPELNRVSWRATPADSMWDVDYIRTFWKERGMDITLGPVDAPAPDLTRPETAFPTTLPEGYTPSQVARLRNVYLSSKSLAALLRQATDAIIATATNMPDRELPLLLDLPCTLFMLRTKTAPRIVKQAAESLRFHPRMHALADTIIQRLQLPAGAFNGLHLRMEDDAQDWANILGGRSKLLQMYLDACDEAGFDSATPVYLASGLFTYGKMDAYKSNIVKRLAQYSSRLAYKETVLKPEDVKGLTKEQLALLDFLVLARSSQFVGIGVSTFSHFLREYRSLQGMAKDTSVLVDGSVIGTDDLFNSSAYITELPPPPGQAPPATSTPPGPTSTASRKQRQLLAHRIVSESCGF